MTQLFDTAPVRSAARKGQSSAGIERSRERWPPPDRDPADIALVAARVLLAAGRLRSRIGGTARAAGVDRDVVLLLLLFSESNQAIRVTQIAEKLGVGKASASRLAARAEAAGLLDKLTDSIDNRRVGCRLSVVGRGAVSRCLDALRPDATEVLRPATDECVLAFQHQLEPSLRPNPPKQQIGWRAGIRTGLPAGE